MSERVLSSEQSKQRSLAHAAVQQACAVRSCSGWVLRALLRAVALGDCNPPVPTAFRTLSPEKTVQKERSDTCSVPSAQGLLSRTTTLA